MSHVLVTDRYCWPDGVRTIALRGLHFHNTATSIITTSGTPSPTEIPIVTSTFSDRLWRRELCAVFKDDEDCVLLLLIEDEVLHSSLLLTLLACGGDELVGVGEGANFEGSKVASAAVELLLMLKA